MRGLVAEACRLLYLFVPLLGGALLVALCTRYNWLPFLAWPLDRRACLFDHRVFGDNKTFRGVIAGTAGTGLSMVVQGRLLHALPRARDLEFVDYSSLPLWRIGLMLGLVRMLGELPNSFVKRQFDISTGQSGDGPWASVWTAIDYVDYLPGAWLVLARWVNITPRRVLISAAVVLLAHHVANAVAYDLGLRRSAH